ncbi:glycoside-pentoside-hexuronide (GPH):cation symporter [Neptunicella marina]|uniref:MFS transporter n=1 Tax=Neptunicella marina TaxID=2125989 RepID=A0A8J6IX48_9ALTE|nr:glycoside-pentoside-hexuronide (GPH):cation symporter [Neptunicella marina]MBC3767160.1 MFS transporter [Neptunicella marina]
MKVSIREKIAYGLGDTASNFIFQTIMLFQTYFYTDIFGLSPAVAGTMFLVVRIFDAVTDPVMGSLADRTKSRWGKFRPYLLFLAIPFGICSVIAFTTPDLSAENKIIYAYLTYGLLMLAYTAINIPYSALGGVLTADVDERVSVQSYRFVLGMTGGLLVSSLTLPMVDYFGNGNPAIGYQRAMMAMSIVGVVLFLICFFGTRERVAPVNDTKVSFAKEAASLWQNDQWRILCIAAVFLLTGMVLRTTLAIYYIKYYLLREDLITTFVTVGMIGNMIGCALAQPLAKRVSKIKAYIGLQLIAAFICVVSFFVGAEQIALAFVLYFLWGMFLQMATPLLWAKIADSVDYGEWKTGVRITGMTYSSVVFFIKLGVALGGAIAGWLLAYYGYQAEIAQTEETKMGILLSFTIFPAVGSVLVALVMRNYKLNNQVLANLQAETGINRQTTA